MFVREPTYSIPADPQWPTAAAWLRGDLGPGKPDRPLFGIIGIPISVSSPAPNGSHGTPFMLPRHLERFAPFAADVGLEAPVQCYLPELLRARDYGIMEIGHLTNVPAQEAIRTELDLRFGPSSGEPRPDLLVAVGGDDAVIRPFLHGLFPELGRVGVLTLDSHHDVRVGYRAQGPHNGAPLRYLIEEGLDGHNIVQIGISPFGNSEPYRRYCEAAGITVVGAAQARRQGVGKCVEANLAALAERVDVIVVDLDFDVIGSDYNPACPGARPGGLTPWQVHEACWAVGRQPKVAGLCLVEVDPTLDPFGCGADNVCLGLLHAAAGLACRP